jgi:hypothetical protein
MDSVAFTFHLHTCSYCVTDSVRFLLVSVLRIPLRLLYIHTHAVTVLWILCVYFLFTHMHLLRCGFYAFTYSSHMHFLCCGFYAFTYSSHTALAVLWILCVYLQFTRMNLLCCGFYAFTYSSHTCTCCGIHCVYFSFTQMHLLCYGFCTSTLHSYTLQSHDSITSVVVCSSFVNV